MKIRNLKTSKKIISNLVGITLVLGTMGGQMITAQKLDNGELTDETIAQLENARKQDEQRKIEETRKAEEEARKAEEERQRQEEQRKIEEARKAEEERQRQAEEEAKRQAEEEAKRQAEEEARKAEEEARKAEEEAKRINEILAWENYLGIIKIDVNSKHAHVILESLVNKITPEAIRCCKSTNHKIEFYEDSKAADNDRIASYNEVLNQINMTTDEAEILRLNQELIGIANCINRSPSIKGYVNEVCNRTICEMDSNDSEAVVLGTAHHELKHVVDVAYGRNFSGSNTFTNIRNHDLYSFMQTIEYNEGNYHEYRNIINEAEYLATAGEAYELNGEDLKEKCPATYLYIEWMNNTVKRDYSFENEIVEQNINYEELQQILEANDFGYLFDDYDKINQKTL